MLQPFHQTKRVQFEEQSPKLLIFVQLILNKLCE